MEKKEVQEKEKMGKKLDGLYFNITSDDESYADSPAKYIKFQEGDKKHIY